MVKTGELCKWCEENPWLSEHMTHVPWPVPSSTHYADVFATPIEIDKIPHPPDDFQPRVQIKKEYNSGALKLKGEES